MQWDGGPNQSSRPPSFNPSFSTREGWRRRRTLLISSSSRPVGDPLSIPPRSRLNERPTEEKVPFSIEGIPADGGRRRRRRSIRGAIPTYGKAKHAAKGGERRRRSPSAVGGRGENIPRCLAHLSGCRWFCRFVWHAATLSPRPGQS